MASKLNILPEHLLHTYIRAKDGNRPHLMALAFSASATLEMQVKTGAVTFPPFTQGVDAITDVLVRRFGQKFENVYTFYLDRPSAYVETFACDWLVGMSEKATGDVYIGCGRYGWTFAKEPELRVTHLLIRIESMQVLPPAELDAVTGWLTKLPYPWCPAGEVASTAPADPRLTPVLEYLTRLQSLPERPTRSR
jgi:hypothetical protein